MLVVGWRAVMVVGWTVLLGCTGVVEVSARDNGRIVARPPWVELW